MVRCRGKRTAEPRLEERGGTSAMVEYGNRLRARARALLACTRALATDGAREPRALGCIGDRPVRQPYSATASGDQDLERGRRYGVSLDHPRDRCSRALAGLR